MTRRLATVRAAWGATLLLAPTTVLSWTSPGPPTAAALTVLRVLGVRHLVQAGAAVRWPSAVESGLGAGTDAVHAATALAFGLASTRWRRPAVADALVATAFCGGRLGGQARPGRPCWWAGIS